MRVKRVAASNRRRGLSTLELVLCLPILLFVMALMMNFGTAACWKIRGLTVARHALWSSRWPRSTVGNPRPKYWPATAGIATRANANVPQLEDPRVDRPVARGLLPFGTVVHTELLDPSRAPRHTSSEITRAYPLLAKMGKYHLEANTRLLDNKWQYLRMSWSKTGYSLRGNRKRRIPVIYDLAKAPREMVDAYIEVLRAILNAPLARRLDPLDRDDEFLYYRGYAPDFHPELVKFCSLDHAVADAHVENLIDRIQGNPNRRPPIPSLAKRMTREFIGLYESVVDQLQKRLDAQPPPSAAERVAILSEINQLQAKLEQLHRFDATL